MDGIVDVPGGVEVGGPQRPRRGREAAGGPGRTSRAETVRPPAAPSYRAWNCGPRTAGRPSARLTAAHTAVAWTRSPPGPVSVVVRSAHRGPVAEQKVSRRTRWPSRGKLRTASAVRRTSQNCGSRQPASARSSSAASCRYRASASSRSRPAGVTSVLRTRRSVLNTRPAGGRAWNACIGLRCLVMGGLVTVGAAAWPVAAFSRTRINPALPGMPGPARGRRPAPAGTLPAGRVPVSAGDGMPGAGQRATPWGPHSRR